MKTKLIFVALCAAALSAQAFAAPPPAGAPAGATGLCKDGSYWTGATKQGACKGHKGVKDWYAATTAATTTAAAPAAAPAMPAAASTPPAKPAMPATPAAAATAAPAAAKAAAATTAAKVAGTPAPGGGPGLVWVNTASKVYHCQGDKNYGTTKVGSYMTEQAAITAGDHADHGKACKS